MQKAQKKDCYTSVLFLFKKNSLTGIMYTKFHQILRL